MLDRDSFNRDGFIVLSEILDGKLIDACLSFFLDRYNSHFGDRETDAFSRHVGMRLSEDKLLQGRVYDDMREALPVLELARSPRIASAVEALFNEPCILARKIPFRIDVPMDARELAVWHQDHFYVKGSTQMLTAWVPMQDTDFPNGCLSVIPGSHRLGPLAHTATVLGKRHLPDPEHYIDGPARYVPMRRGDVLLFHSCLLHSGNMNLTESTRFSLQSRYCPISAPTADHMGKRIPL